MVARIVRVSMVLLLIAGSIQIDGCAHSLKSVEGLDPAGTHPLVVDPWKMTRVEIGTPMTVWMRDGRTLEGRFGGFLSASDADYAARYDVWRAGAAAGVALPLGAPVRWQSVAGVSDSGTFAGYDLYSVVLMSSGRQRKVVRMRDLARLEGGGDVPVTGDSLTRMCDAGLLPLVTGLRLGTPQGPRRLELDRVERMHANGMPVALGIGIITGVVVVALVIAANQPHTPPRQSSSCDNTSLGGYAVIGPAARTHPPLAAR